MKTTILMVVTLLIATTCVAKNTSAISFGYSDRDGLIYVKVQNETWIQKRIIGTEIVEKGWLNKNTLLLVFVDQNKNRIEAKWQFKKGELHCEVHCSENVSVSYPWPFIRAETNETDHLLIPVAEGMLYPAHDASLKPYDWLKGNAGYGISLPLFGTVNDAGSGYGFYTEDPDYFEIKVAWINQWTLTPTWVPAENEFGVRKCRYLFFQKESHAQAVVTIAKWYRQWLKEKGYLVPLTKKKAKSARPEELVARPHIWVWSDPLQVAGFLKELGIDRALLANVDPKYWTVNRDILNQIHEMGFLTGRYDNYEDRWPKELSEVTEWTEGYPEGLVLTKYGNTVPAWIMTAPNGKQYTGAKLCSSYGKDLIEKDLTPELKKLPMKTRFIDTMTATELRECFNPNHSHDRTGDRQDRMAILDYSRHQVLTGSEKMTWWGIPVCHYSMGILSLNPYPPADDIGANPSKILDEVKEDYLRFDVGYQYRIPLFELVAHDCVLPTWYWGDGNNKHPATWREKDLFTILYGGIPMWCFSSLEVMANYADSLKSSYNFVKPALEQIGMAEMVSFEVLNKSGTLQQTRWGNGAAVIVNFGAKTDSLAVNGVMISVPPKSYHLVSATPLPWWKQWLDVIF
ncbi:MAG: hypothetical protein COT24_02030 [Candidatus Kerfeldbacteria bacterium CG08_land_8_20_14_0_20_40_16]|uniref:Uncharacterized protein n=1 Tax=Candidatus Kerfeldbacteria bacterium CG08_land_8_20_14_0_20_40_16 TaxID=2014244 RepID=A0A2H0YW78_9BACT|nr:MAG: hypothetical protein COT24_02030 [Candidatus Kerfeldbacteria bacterium CG08_land_8_20_14_0_20_40_16]